jgi:hypothetical protein
MLATALALVAVGAQSYPPPFPRPGVTKLLENSRVVVWNIAWPKGQPTALHRHVYDLVGTYYTSGDRVITEVDGSKRNVTNKPGEITFRQKGLTHIEEGISDRPLRAVFIELKEDGPSGVAVPESDVAASFHDIGGRQLLDNPASACGRTDGDSARTDRGIATTATRSPYGSRTERRTPSSYPRARFTVKNRPASSTSRRSSS